MTKLEEVKWFRNWAWDKGVSNRVVNIFSREIGLGHATLDYICKKDPEFFHINWSGVGVGCMNEIAGFLDDLRKDWLDANSVSKEM